MPSEQTTNDMPADHRRRRRRRARKRRRRSADQAADPTAPPPIKKSPTSKQQVREANDRALRSHAELENIASASQRELADERRYAVVPLVRDLLPVVDNLERAIEAAQTSSQRGRLSGARCSTA